jgi:predicted nucleic acid-binding protein
MSGRCFLDTNILVYSFDRANPAKAAVARRLIQQSLRDRSGIISFQVIQEFFNVAFKRMPAFAVSLDAELYLSAVLRPLLAVQSSVGLYGEGLRLQQRYRVSWYDALIIAAANEAACGLLYTEDLQDGAQFEGVKAKNPF